MHYAIIKTVKIKTAANFIRLAFFHFRKILSPQRFAITEASKDYTTGNTKSFVLCFTLMKIAFHFGSVQSHHH